MGVRATFSVLAAMPPDRQLPFIEAALREPHPAIQSAAFEALLAPPLNRPELVLVHYADLLPLVKARIAERKQSFLLTAREQIRSDQERVRGAAYLVVAAIGEFDALPTLVQGVTDPATAVREIAVAAVEKLALRYRVHLAAARAPGDPKSREFVERYGGLMQATLETLLRVWGSHRNTVFLEVLLEAGAESYGSITAIALARPETELYRDFSKTLAAAGGDGALEILFKLSLEREPRLSEPAVQAMRSRQDPEFARALAAHFARLSPERLGALASKVRELPWWPAVEAAGLGPTEAGAVMEFLSRTGLADERRHSLLQTFLRHESPDVRARALSLLYEGGLARIVDVAARALEDPADEVKLEAARVIMRVNPPQKARLLAPLVNASSPVVRGLATRAVAGVSFAKYMTSFDRLDLRTRQDAARALAKIDENIVFRLAEELGSLDPQRRLKALQITGYVDAQKDLQKILMDLLSDPDRRVRATAIKIVELTGSAEGMKLLLSALGDPDPRVRANAVEAFEEIGDIRFAQALLPRLQDEDNRVRANAAKALWTLGRREGRETLEAMLASPDEERRLSALWAIGEVRFEGWEELLRRRAAADPADRVRARIAELLEGRGA